MRHLSRHLQATVQDHVLRLLEVQGWVGPAEGVPFGALPVAFQRVRPSESLLVSIKPNLVAVSFGRQGDDAPQEMGGGIDEQEHTFFVDVYAENEGIGLALSEDIRDLFVGRASYVGWPSRFVQLEDQTTQPPTPVPGYRIEFDEVLRTPADRELASVDWQVVSGAARILLPGAGR